VTDIPVEIPNRAAFRAAEVCEIAQIPAYVLRSWEKEFPGLGAAARPGGPRIYRRSDVEQILRIKQLVFAEGLTLAGVRRRIEGDPPDEEEMLLETASPNTVGPASVPADVRTRVSLAKRELRELLDMLIGEAPAVEAPRDTAAQPVAGPTAVDTAAAAPAAASQNGPAAGADDLPLLNSVLDTPPKPRRIRRTTKQAPWGPPSEVE
jgi:DNA-binding transcriptional MerR regulator